MSSPLADFATLLAVNEDILVDKNRPVIKQLNPLDEIEVQLTLLEADNLVEVYFEQYRPRFTNPEFFEALREVHRTKYREHILELVEWARSLVVGGIEVKTELKQSLDQNLSDDGWIVERKSPLEIRNINGTFISGQAAADLLNHYRNGGRYGKQ